MTAINWRPLLIVAVLLVAWELAMRITGVVTESFAPPTQVAVAFVGIVLDGGLLRGTLQTLETAAIGLAFGAGGGILLGTLMGLYSPLAVAIRAPVEILRTMPSVALIPLSLMVFGFGTPMEAAIIIFATFWPSLVLSLHAVRAVDRQLLAVAAALELGPVARIVKIVLPAVTPRLLVALRLAIGIALIVAVTVEIVANPRGLGYSLVIAQQSLRPAPMIAYLLWIGVIGWGLNIVMVKIEARLRRRMGVVEE